MLLRIEPWEKIKLLEFIGYPMEKYEEDKNLIECFYSIINEKTWFQYKDEFYEKQEEVFEDGRYEALVELANAGYAPAQLAVAAYHIQNWDWSVDDQELCKDIVRWLNSAASQGKKEAYFWLAKMYHEEMGDLEHDEDKIIRLLQKADSREFFPNDLLGDYLEGRDFYEAQECFDRMKAAALEFEPDLRFAYRAGSIDPTWWAEIQSDMENAAALITDIRFFAMIDEAPYIRSALKQDKFAICEQMVVGMSRYNLMSRNIMANKLAESNKKIQQISNENDRLKEENKKCISLQAENDDLKEKNDSLEQKNVGLQNEIRHINSEYKKSAKSEKYGSKKVRGVDEDKRTCLSGVEQALADKTAHLERAQDEIRRLTNELAHVKTVCDNRGEELAKAEHEKHTLQTERDGLQDIINERDKTIESQKIHIRELNRTAKFQPKEAKNLTAEDMVRALQDRDKIKHLERSLSEEKKENKMLKEENDELKEKLEQYAIYGFVKE